MNTINFKKDLNPEQYKAVTHENGPLLVIAGAGSGKTKVITYRIAYLLQNKNINLNNIMAVTFTNKAANEMKERLSKLLNKDMTKALYIGTFHSTAFKIIKSDYDLFGVDRNFIIFDSSDQMSLIKECLDELNINKEKFSPGQFKAAISDAKNNFIDCKKFKEQNLNDFKKIQLINVYELYQKKLKDNNALDFDDLIFYFVDGMLKNSKLREKYQNLLNHILVDEYQDTNFSQYQLLKLLSEKHKNIFAVGDDSQSIYSWRGADINNILNFEKDFPDSKIIKLEQNYRSTKTILEASNYLISKNLNQKKKKLWTENEDGDSIKIIKVNDEYEEAELISKEISRLTKNSNFKFSDIAIFYRTNAQSRILETKLRSFNIPYVVIGGLKFYDRKEIKDILAYLRLILNPKDKISLKRIINIPKRGIGESTIDKIFELANLNKCDVFDIIENIEKFDEIFTKSKKRILEFYYTLKDLIEKYEKMNLKDYISYFLEKISYIEYLEQTFKWQANEKIENINEFTNAIAELVESGRNLEDFLSEVSLSSDIDDMEIEDKFHEKVSLMTLHSAKGLEYPIVFICGVEENIIPHSLSLDSIEQLEEERRLFYVGMTRAKKHLVLTTAESRKIFGNMRLSKPSRFLNELPKEHIQYFFTSSNYFSCIYENEKLKKDETKTIINNNNNIKQGQTVIHAKFGKGIVLSTEGTGDNQKVKIDFEDNGVKTLIVKYANLNICNL